jgi:hypothetical protein
LASTYPLDKTRPLTIVLIHGRDFKPDKDALRESWVNAIRCGLLRDHPALIPAFDAAAKVLAYYGDATAVLLKAAGKTYDEPLDIADRRNALTALATLEPKKFRRSQYERLPGKTPFREFLVDIGAPLVSSMGLAKWVVGRVIPELAEYWRDGGAYRTAVDRCVVETLVGAIERGDRLLVLSHCIGSIAAFNALWMLSRGGHGDGRYTNAKVDTFVTLGSPLADESVKRKLLGADAPQSQRYPGNIVNWHNFAAEDDFTCHDETMANDYKAMLEQRVISRIVDQRIYNLTVRYGRSNPHSAIGYLVHPRVTNVIAQTL